MSIVNTNRPNSIYIPTPLKMESAKMETQTKMVSTGTNTDNEEFANTSVYVCDLEVLEIEEHGIHYTCYQLFGYYFPFDFPIYKAIKSYLNSLQFDENVRRYACQVGIAPERYMQYKMHGKVLFSVPLYRRVDLAMPTMLVYRNCIFDIHVPLHIVFYPKGKDLRDENGEGIGIVLYSGPADITCPGSENNYCSNCAAYGIYNGVFIALCASCSDNSYDGRYSYTGYARMGIDFYCIPPERRLNALPEYFPDNICLEDIGYTTLKTEYCSAISFSVDDKSDQSYLYLEHLVRDLEQPEEEDDEDDDFEREYKNLIDRAIKQEISELGRYGDEERYADDYDDDCDY
jgi:hypothetical protein